MRKSKLGFKGKIMTNLVNSYDTVDQWMDWGDHTVTIDPMRTNPWIHEGQDRKHLDSVEKGRSHDRQDTLKLLSLLKSDTPSEAYVHTYLPTTGEITGGLQHHPGDGPTNSHGVPAPFNQRLSYRDGEISTGSDMKRSIIDHLHRGNAFTEEDKGAIERQVYGNRKHVQDRVFSRGGVPDHGIQST